MGLCNGKVQFAGKVACFCGQFCQILSVAPGASPDKTSCASFWDETEVTYVTASMRGVPVDRFGQQAAASDRQRQYEHLQDRWTRCKRSLAP